MTEQDPRGVVESYLDALRERDAEAIPRLIAPHAVYRIPGDHALAGTHTGLPRIVEDFLLPMGALFDPDAAYTVQVSAIVADGGHVAVECVSRGTTRAGHPYEIDISSHFTVEHGQIVHMREYFDTQYFVRTLFGRAAER